MSSEELNERIVKLADDTESFRVEGLSQHGKVIPYIGWYWRSVDFARPIRFGDCGAFVGFMERNKWGYDAWTVTPEQDAELKRQLIAIADHPTDDLLQAFFDYVQTCKPTPPSTRGE